MTQIFDGEGNVVPVTMVLAQPNIVTQVKTKAQDGYDAVQVGFGPVKHPKKAQSGHLKGLAPVRTMREFRLSAQEASQLKRGDAINVEIFAIGDKVNVIGIAKGRGFQGVVKRHGFHGHPSSHGHKDAERMPGSIGAGGVQRVFKGVRMAGHMGDNQVTVKGLTVAQIDAAKNILYIKGAVPGGRNGLLLISGPGELKVKAAPASAAQAAFDAAPAEKAASEINA